MVRSLFLGCAVLIATLLTSVGFARAQAVPQTPVVQRLDVRTLTESVDHSVVTVGMTFRLKIHASISESVNHLDALDLPTLEDFEQRSSERHFTPNGGGTLFDQTLVLVAKHAGSIAIGPVSIDAINSRTGLASKFSSTDDVVVHVLPPIPQAPSIAREAMVQYAAIAAIALSVAVLSYQIGSMFLRWMSDGVGRKRSASKTEVKQSAPRAALVRTSPLRRLRDALAEIRREPSQAHAEEVRAALRTALGASDEETLADIVARMPPEQHGILERALRAAERAAFIETAYRRSAIEDGLPLFEAALHRLEN